MPRFSSLVIAVLSLATAVPSWCEERRKPHYDLYYGEAKYLASQGLNFEALERLDIELAQHHAVDEPELGSLFPVVDEAEFSVGDYELRYRMHHRAGRAIQALLEGDVEAPVRNEAAYRLAKIHFQKGQFGDAMSVLARIEGEVPRPIRDDIEFLRANIYLAMDEPAQAVEVLQGLQSEADLDGFVAYNLGIALLEAGQLEHAYQQLDKAGRIPAEDEAAKAIRDKSNLVLGTVMLESGRYAEARHYLDRVRLTGPFTNQALLSAGWASMSAEQYDSATVPWRILADRDATDAATQEAMLGLPYAYSKLRIHGRAAENFGRALDVFSTEAKKIDASIESIREGKFLAALIREEIRQDKDWVIRLRSLPETPETYYLTALLASHDFQTGLQNYLDLEGLRQKLRAWQKSFVAFDDMVTIRRGHYEPLLPEVDAEFRELDSRMKMRLEQNRLLEEHLRTQLTAPRPNFLATREEQQLLADIEGIEQRLQNGNEAENPDVAERVARLKGRLLWDIHTDYYGRLDAFYAHLQELWDANDVLETTYRQFVRVRQAATHSYEGYMEPVNRMRTRVTESLGRVNMLMARQGRLLEVVAVDELVARRQRLDQYMENARYALADSYDRATQARVSEGDD
jgi:tetratricopeptide (TPR) repeat protein